MSKTGLDYVDQLEQLRADLERVTKARQDDLDECERLSRELRDMRTELAKLQQAWALRELELNRLDCLYPETVAALIRAGAGLPIGECDVCHNRAPLQSAFAQSGPESQVCASGCPCGAEGSKGDGE